MSAARFRQVAITQAISIVADAAQAGRPLGEHSDALIELLEHLRAEEQALPDLHVPERPDVMPTHYVLGTPIVGRPWPNGHIGTVDATAAMGMDGEEPVTLSGTTLPHRALNIEVRP